MNCELILRAHFTILYSGGNSEDIGQVTEWVKLMVETLRVSFIPAFKSRSISSFMTFPASD